MFKTVEYVGFDGQPDLKARAEQLTPVLANGATRWRPDTEVVWSPAPGAAGSLNVTLSLALPSGAAGSALTTFRPKDLADNGWAEIRCAFARMGLLGALRDCLAERLRESMTEGPTPEPVEV